MMYLVDIIILKYKYDMKLYKKCVPINNFS